MTGAPMHAAILAQPDPAAQLPTTQPGMYASIMQQVQAQWAAEDEQIMAERKAALHQMVLAACASPSMPQPGLPAMPVDAAAAGSEGY